MASSSSSTSHWRTSSSDGRSFTQSHSSIVPEGTVVITSVAESRKVEDKKMVNQYEFQESLGRGQHGEVSIARDTITETIAIKAVKRKNPKVDRMSQLRKNHLPVSPHLPLTDKLGITEQKIRKEIAIMKKCNHPHVVKLLEVIDDGLNEKIYMVMEYLGGGEIKWRTEGDEPALRVSQTRRICRDVILGLEYLHHHGIIHRDIKPANLLWSSDRRMVKIADFGVSHFSYAQQLAAAGQEGYSPEDDILMNEADLYKFAGTPMFLAPEILYDSGADTSTSSSTASNLYALGSESTGSAGATTPRKKPTITKAVDIWALGVTLYALLFGQMPFAGDGEWAIYGKIKEDDWEVPETMGSDGLPVGGRFQSRPSESEDVEGYLVIKLLDSFLQKDPNKRITLDGVKHHPWILHDMPNADQWLRQTAIEESFAVTDDETKSAVSSVKFRWPRSIAKGLYSLIRNVRPQRSF
ncbi:kinase-like domain-containing protein, partial [Irpex rosettiformis]